MMELDSRKLGILKAIIDEYILSASPVGSRAISKLEGFSLSSATIRNEMADLEELGYLEQPHTSAGRIPTDKGYRLFVDSLLTVRPLQSSELSEMKEAGVDSLKIEGRMKSLYYTALVTRAYRKRLDALEGRVPEAEAEPFAAELSNVAHREFATGFYFSKDEANKTTVGETSSPYILAGTIGKENEGNAEGMAHQPAPQGFHDFEFISMNKIDAGTPLEYVGPDVLAIEDSDYTLFDPETGATRAWVCHGHPCVLRTDKPVKDRFIVRARDPEWTAAQDAPRPDRTPKSTLA